MLYFSSVLAVIPLHTSLNWISLQIHVSNFWNRFSTVSVLVKYPDQTNYQMWDFPWPQRICLETVSDSSRRFNRFFYFSERFAIEGKYIRFYVYGYWDIASFHAVKRQRCHFLFGWRVDFRRLYILPVFVKGWSAL